LELHKAMEANRLSLSETQRDIIMRALLYAPRADRASPHRTRKTRRTGEYQVYLLGEVVTGKSLKEILKNALLRLERKKPGSLKSLARRRTPRGRYIVAARPEDLYPRRPQLLPRAERLDGNWWYDTNISFNQTQRYLRTLAELTGAKEIPEIRKAA
jgi:hypothetical protein